MNRTSSMLAGSCFLSCAAAFQVAAPSPYLGQPVPGLTPTLFAPGIVSTDAIELNGVFTPDMREFFFARGMDAQPTIFHSQRIDGAWSAPRELFLYPEKARALAVDMAVSPDGNELFFLGNYQPPGAAGARSPDIWRSRRVNGEWTTAEKVPAPISTEAREIYPTVVADGSLYFISDRPGAVGSTSVYRAQRRPDGSFATPVLVPPPINGEFGVGDPFVSPDEKYMIFVSRRPPNLGAGDLFVSFRAADGTWGEPVHLGDTVNTDKTDFCPFVTPDGKYFFFSRRHTVDGKVTAGDVYWMDAKFLDRFRK